MEIDGIQVAQMPIQLELFDEMISKFKLYTIIELGLYHGGPANVLMKKQCGTTIWRKVK